ncbi:hypothetical protein FSP39_023586, partial [Pinctada imbricata]
RDKVVEMFHHAYDSYMQNAFPADELMPLSCKGRYRGTEPSRGDIDDSLGNFTLTLIDTLDTLAVLGELEHFDTAVRLVIEYAKFDSDIIVSVFETNIRILGGLLGGHVVASYLKRKQKAMHWYNDELLNMAKDVGYRLLPAFNTTTGIPYPRINLKYGLKKDNIDQRYKDTCTACAGTMILEFAALSRLTGDHVFEDKAHKAMDYLWKQRHRTSDLVGTVINIHNGDWVRRESGVGAGIDSYYEYVLKAYILLGDDKYLSRFNKHYSAIKKYITQGPLLVDVHMHKPNSASRNFMDSLLAFWPGLQVLKGDIQSAVEIHEMLYQVIQRHNFLPEGFTTDFRIHWGHHPLRPEFLESTYFLHKATGDPHYLEVGKMVLENLNKHARVPCGFAALKDIVSGKHEDQLDSYVLAETFKYLYLLFAEKTDLEINIDEYIFTTEAHLLPLSLSVFNNNTNNLSPVRPEVYKVLDDLGDLSLGDTDLEDEHDTCPNPLHVYKGMPHYAFLFRSEMKGFVDRASPRSPPPSGSCRVDRHRLKAAEFIAGNKAQLAQLNNMGIKIVTMNDGRIQLLHSAAEALTPDDAEDGMKFMQEMIELSKTQKQDQQQEPMVVQLISEPYFGALHFKAGPAQFGYSLKINPPVQGQLAIADPYNACSTILNPEILEGRIAILQRGSCMFIDKARNLQKIGAIGGIVIDNNEDSTSENNPIFAMSGDGQQDVKIPMVFLFQKEGNHILETLKDFPALTVLLSYEPKSEDMFQPYSGKDSDTAAPPSGPGSQAQKETNQPDKTGSTKPHSESSQSKQDFLEEIDPNQWVKISVNDRVIPGEEIIVKSELVGQKQYRLQTGSHNVKMDVKVSTKSSGSPESPEVIDDDVIKIITLPDGRKQLSFKFDQISQRMPKTKPELNQIYVDLVQILQDRTNFASLPSQGDYLLAIARLLESAYFNQGNVDSRSQKMFDKLAQELQIVKKDVVKQDSVFSHGGKIDDDSHYRSSGSRVETTQKSNTHSSSGHIHHYYQIQDFLDEQNSVEQKSAQSSKSDRESVSEKNSPVSDNQKTFHYLTEAQSDVLSAEEHIEKFESSIASDASTVPYSAHHKDSVIHESPVESESNDVSKKSKTKGENLKFEQKKDEL